MLTFIKNMFKEAALKKLYFKRYAELGGKPYVPMMLCAEKEPDGSTWTWGSPDRFWDGPPVPKAKDIEAWEDQNKKNQFAREWAHREVYENSPTPWLP